MLILILQKNLAISLGVIPEKIIVINPGIEPIEKLDDKSLKEAEKILKGKKSKINYSFKIR